MEKIDQLNIKGMVCNRCIAVLDKELGNKGYDIKKISLGKVLFNKPVTKDKIRNIREIIEPLGFEHFSDGKQKLHSQVKKEIKKWVDATPETKKDTLSNHLSKKFHINYDTLAVLFSGLEGITIEKYHINKRIESVKELLVYTNLSLSEIAFRKGFSSAQHLSSHFKQNTGLAPSYLRKLKAEKKD